jgi:hypothetical protein
MIGWAWLAPACVTHTHTFLVHIYVDMRLVPTNPGRNANMLEFWRLISLLICFCFARCACRTSGADCCTPMSWGRQSILHQPLKQESLLLVSFMGWLAYLYRVTSLAFGSSLHLIRCVNVHTYLYILQRVLQYREETKAHIHTFIGMCILYADGDD